MQIDLVTGDETLEKSAVVEIVNGSGVGEFLVICEHASNFVPAELNTLGLSEETLLSHIAWDPGAIEVARMVSENLQSPLIAQKISRLVYDCNRPLDAKDAAPYFTERGTVPGNKDLPLAEIRRRFDAYYAPFWTAINNQLNGGAQKALVTIHSFTPVYNGKTRAVEVGVLHDEESPFADILLDEMRMSGNYNVCRNEPYAPVDGVTHTLREHGVSRGLPNVMIEIRNDLLVTEAHRVKMAEWLGAKLSVSLAKLQNG
ncbi:MAG: N-formylglutamate amidohydrolase [Sneathiella sp.]